MRYDADANELKRVETNDCDTHTHKPYAIERYVSILRQPTNLFFFSRLFYLLIVCWFSIPFQLSFRMPVQCVAGITFQRANTTQHIHRAVIIIIKHHKSVAHDKRLMGFEEWMPGWQHWLVQYSHCSGCTVSSICIRKRGKKTFFFFVIKHCSWALELLRHAIFFHLVVVVVWLLLKIFTTQMNWNNNISSCITAHHASHPLVTSSQTTTTTTTTAATTTLVRYDINCNCCDEDLFTKLWRNYNVFVSNYAMVADAGSTTTAQGNDEQFIFIDLCPPCPVFTDRILHYIHRYQLFTRSCITFITNGNVSFVIILLSLNDERQLPMLSSMSGAKKKKPEFPTDRQTQGETRWSRKIESFHLLYCAAATDWAPSPITISIQATAVNEVIHPKQKSRINHAMFINKRKMNAQNTSQSLTSAPSQ